MGLCENSLKVSLPLPFPRSHCIYSLLIAVPVNMPQEHLLPAEQPVRSLHT